MYGPTSLILDTMRLGWSMARLGLEAQEVMTIRLAGLAGFWNLPPGEATRMVAEKGPAFADAWSRGAVELAKGATSAAAIGASLGPLHQRTRANRRRLSGRGWL